MAKPALTFRRLVGLDRSGGPPPATRRGEALHPWTIPNAIGFARIALIPVFLVVALESDDGRDATAFALFAVIAWTDYLDGMAARITGQYSRLGALLDPLTDRLLVIAGAIVAWEFHLLPRWALLVLAAREALMLGAHAGRAAAWDRPQRQHAGPLGGLADDERAGPRARLGQLGARGAALRRPGHDPCGDRCLPARWAARDSPRLNLYLRKCYGRFGRVKRTRKD